MNSIGTMRERIAAVIMDSCHGVFVDDAVDAADAVIAELQPELTRHDIGCVCDECWFNR